MRRRRRHQDNPSQGRLFELPRFVLNEHHATHLHYDFRLEMGGVLKSWVIPKGPSLDPNVWRLAVRVPDHSLGRIRFQGRIRYGYGAGMVRTWDRGTFNWIDENPRLAWLAGRLRFMLQGGRLQGAWELVRKTLRGGKVLWLLRKVADHWAKPGHVAEVIGEE